MHNICANQENKYFNLYIPVKQHCNIYKINAQTYHIAANLTDNCRPYRIS